MSMFIILRHTPSLHAHPQPYAVAETTAQAVEVICKADPTAQFQRVLSAWLALPDKLAQHCHTQMIPADASVRDVLWYFQQVHTAEELLGE